MEDYRLGEQETRFANLIWDNAPINSAELVKLAAGVMRWKKSTTYTMLRRLCERKIFKNENAAVTVLMSRDEFYGGQSRKYVGDTFGGSLPRFITSFIGGGRLSERQADELVRLINEHKEGCRNG
ncbi:MAG: BlaI/MecI/CopY family transcriptional regulator [Oscillospiraceae bacterium]|jgi:predicted transcriptional regulator|nr:BlaI/MecI/CopY family transcriptional regulator [Oscillospiraceae bacterium]